MVTKEEVWWARWGGDKSGAWDEHTHTTIYKIDNNKDLLYRELYSIFLDNLYKNIKK